MNRDVARHSRRAATPGESRSAVVGAAAAVAMRRRLQTPDPTTASSPSQQQQQQQQTGGVRSSSSSGGGGGVRAHQGLPPRSSGRPPRGGIATAVSLPAVPGGRRSQQQQPNNNDVLQQTVDDAELAEVRRHVAQAFGDGAQSVALAPAAESSATQEANARAPGGGGTSGASLTKQRSGAAGRPKTRTESRLSQSPLLLQQRLEDARSKLATASTRAGLASQKSQRRHASGASAMSETTTATRRAGSKPSVSGSSLPPVRQQQAGTTTDSDGTNLLYTQQHATADRHHEQPPHEIPVNLAEWQYEQQDLLAQMDADMARAQRAAAAASRDPYTNVPKDDAAAIRANRPPRGPQPWAAGDAYTDTKQRASRKPLRSDEVVRTSNAAAVALAKRDADRKRHQHQSRPLSSQSRVSSATATASARKHRDEVHPLRAAFATLQDGSSSSKDLTATALTDLDDVEAFAQVLSTSKAVSELLLDGLVLPAVLPVVGGSSPKRGTVHTPRRALRMRRHQRRKKSDSGEADAGTKATRDEPAAVASTAAVSTSRTEQSHAPHTATVSARTAASSAHSSFPPSTIPPTPSTTLSSSSPPLTPKTPVSNAASSAACASPQSSGRAGSNKSASSVHGDDGEDGDDYGSDSFASTPASTPPAASCSPSPSPRATDESPRRGSSSSSSRASSSEPKTKQQPSAAADAPTAADTTQRSGDDGNAELDPLDFEPLDVDAVCRRIPSRPEQLLVRAIAANPTPITNVSLADVDATTVSSEFVAAVKRVCRTNRAQQKLVALEREAVVAAEKAAMDEAEALGISRLYLKEYGDRRDALRKAERSERGKITLAFQTLKRAALKRQLWAEVLGRLRKATSALERKELERRNTVLWGTFVRGLLKITESEEEQSCRAEVARKELAERHVIWADHCLRWRTVTTTQKVRVASRIAARALLEADERKARSEVVDQRWEGVMELLRQSSETEAAALRVTQEERVRVDEQRRKAVAAAQDAASAAERQRELTLYQSNQRSDRLGRTITGYDRDLTRLAKGLESSHSTVMRAFTALRSIHENFVVRAQRVHSLHHQVAMNFAEPPTVSIAASGHGSISAVFQPSTLTTATSDVMSAPATTDWVPIEPTLVVSLDMDRLWQIRLGLVARELERLVNQVQAAVIDMQDESVLHLQALDNARRTAMAAAPKQADGDKSRRPSATPRNDDSGGGGDHLAAPQHSQRRRSTLGAGGGGEMDMSRSLLPPPLSHDGGTAAPETPTSPGAPGAMPGTKGTEKATSATHQFRRYLRKPVELTAAHLDLARINSVESIENIRQRKLTLFSGIVSAQLDERAARYCALRYTGDWDTVEMDDDGQPIRFIPSPVRAARNNNAASFSRLDGSCSPDGNTTGGMSRATFNDDADDDSGRNDNNNAAGPRPVAETAPSSPTLAPLAIDPSVTVSGTAAIHLDVPPGATKEDLEHQLRSFSVAVIAPVPEPLIASLNLKLDLRALKVRSFLGRVHSRLARLSVRMPSGISVRRDTELQFLLAPPLLKLPPREPAAAGTATTTASGSRDVAERHDGRAGGMSLLSGIIAQEPPPVARETLHSTKLRLAVGEDASLLVQRRMTQLQTNNNTSVCSDRDDDSPLNMTTNASFADTLRSEGTHASGGGTTPGRSAAKATEQVHAWVRAGAFRGLHVTITPLVCDSREDRVAVAAAAMPSAGPFLITSPTGGAPGGFTAFATPPALGHSYDETGGSAERREDDDDAGDGDPLNLGDAANDSVAGPAVTASADGRDVYVDGMHVAVATRPKAGALELQFITELTLDGARHVIPVLNALQYRNTQFDPTTGERSYRITAASSGGVSVDLTKLIDVFVVDKPTELQLQEKQIAFPALAPPSVPEALIRSVAHEEDPLMPSFLRREQTGGTDDESSTGQQQKQEVEDIALADCLRRIIPLAPEAVLHDPAKTFFDGGTMRVHLAREQDKQDDDDGDGEEDAPSLLGVEYALGIDAQLAAVPLPAAITLVPPMVVGDDWDEGNAEQQQSGWDSVALAALELPGVVADDASEDLEQLRRAVRGLGEDSRRGGYVGGNRPHLVGDHVRRKSRFAAAAATSSNALSTAETGVFTHHQQSPRDTNQQATASTLVSGAISAAVTRSKNDSDEDPGQQATGDGASTVFEQYDVFVDGVKVATLRAKLALPPGSPSAGAAAAAPSSTSPASGENDGDVAKVQNHHSTLFRHCVQLEFTFERYGRATLDAAEAVLRAITVSLPPRLSAAAKAAAERRPVAAMFHVALGPSYGRRDISGNDVVPVVDDRPAIGKIAIRELDAHVSLGDEEERDDGDDAYVVRYSENSGACLPFLGFKSAVENRSAADHPAASNRLGGGGFIFVSVASGADDCDGLGIVDHAEVQALREAAVQSVSIVPNASLSLSASGIDAPAPASAPTSPTARVRAAAKRAAASSKRGPEVIPLKSDPVTGALQDPLSSSTVVRAPQKLRTVAAVETLRAERAEAASAAGADSLSVGDKAATASPSTAPLSLGGGGGAGGRRGTMRAGSRRSSLNTMSPSRRRASSGSKGHAAARDAARRREEEQTLIASARIALEPLHNELPSLLAAPVTASELRLPTQQHHHHTRPPASLSPNVFGRRVSDLSSDGGFSSAQGRPGRRRGAEPGSPLASPAPQQPLAAGASSSPGGGAGIVPTRDEVTLQSSGLFNLASNSTANFDDEADDGAADRRLRSLARRARAMDLARSASPQGTAGTGFRAASTRLAVALLLRRRRLLEQRGVDDTFVHDSKAFTVYHTGSPIGTAFIHTAEPKLAVAFDPAVTITDSMVRDVLQSITYANWSRDPHLLHKVLRVDVNRPGHGTCTGLRGVQIVPYDDPTEVVIGEPVIRVRVGATAANIPALPTNSSSYLGNGNLGGAPGHGGKLGKPLRVQIPGVLPDSPPQLVDGCRPTATRLFPSTTTTISDPDTQNWDGGFVDVYSREAYVVELSGDPGAPHGIDAETGEPLPAPPAMTTIETAIATSAKTVTATFAGVLRHFPVAPDGAEQPMFSPTLTSEWLRGPVGRASSLLGSFLQYRFASVAETANMRRRQHQQLVLGSHNPHDGAGNSDETRLSGHRGGALFVAAESIGERWLPDWVPEPRDDAPDLFAASLSMSASASAVVSPTSERSSPDVPLTWLRSGGRRLDSGASLCATWREDGVPLPFAGASTPRARHPQARLIAQVADEEVIEHVALSLVNADGDVEVDTVAIAEVTVVRRAQLWEQPGEKPKPKEAPAAPTAKGKDGKKKVEEADTKSRGGKSSRAEPQAQTAAATAAAPEEAEDEPLAPRFSISVDAEYRLCIALAPARQRDSRFVSVGLLRQIVDAIGFVCHPVPTPPPATCGASVLGSVVPGAPPPCVVSGAGGMCRQVWHRQETLRLPQLPAEFHHFIRIVDADNPLRPGGASVATRCLPPLVTVADLTPGYNGYAVCSDPAGSSPASPTAAASTTAASGGGGASNLTVDASPPRGASPGGGRRRATTSGDQALLPLVRGASYPPPCVQPMPDAARRGRNTSAMCGALLPVVPTPPVRPHATCWLNAVGALGRNTTPAISAPPSGSGTPAPDGGLTPPQSQSFHGQPHQPHHHQQPGHHQQHALGRTSAAAYAEFPLHALRHYPIRAAVEGRADYVFPMAVACIALGPLHADPPPGASASGSAYAALAGVPPAMAGKATERVTMTVDIFIAAGSNPRDRLLLNYNGTNFVTTADGIVVWQKEAVCRCTVNSPHHLRFDAVKELHRGATRARMERLLQCLQFQVMLPDPREKDQIGGAPRIVAVVVSEPPPPGSSAAAAATAADRRGAFGATSAGGGGGGAEARGSVSAAPGAVGPPSSSAPAPSGVPLPVPADQNGLPEASAVCVQITVADGGALSSQTTLSF